MKKLAASEKSEELPCNNSQPNIEITVTSTIHLKLTGDETIDKKLKDLKKVL